MGSHETTVEVAYKGLGGMDGMICCKHISYDELEQKYLVYEPAIIKPVMKGETIKGFKCSKCKTNIPINVRSNGAVRIRLISLKEQMLTH